MTLQTWVERFGGSWSGHNLLRLSWLNPSDFISAGSCRVELEEHGTWIDLVYTWSHEGKHHKGRMTITLDRKTGVVTVGWTDSWHQSAAVMLLRGTVDERGIVDVRGTYPAPPDPDWGWRIVIDPTHKKTLFMRMYNIPHNGAEDLAVEAEYAPVVRARRTKRGRTRARPRTSRRRT